MECFPEPVEIVMLSQTRRLKYIMNSCSASYKFEGPLCVSLLKAGDAARWDSANTFAPYQQSREKNPSVSADVIKDYEEEFLFGTKKSLFLDMRRFRFLSEVSWETANFAFIYFIFYVMVFFISF